MKYLLYISFFFLSQLSFSQSTSSEANIVKKDSKKLQFDDIKIESEAEHQYKTLELRYKKFSSPTATEITVNETVYKSFPTKQAAVRYYFAVKQSAPSKVVYYVYSVENKKPEVVSFRVE